MKIIKKGINPNKRVYEGTCYNCNTIIEFKKDEAEYVSDQKDGDFLRVVCPECKNNINVSVNEYKRSDSAESYYNK